MLDLDDFLTALNLCLEENDDISFESETQHVTSYYLIYQLKATEHEKKNDTRDLHRSTYTSIFMQEPTLTGRRS